MGGGSVGFGAGAGENGAVGSPGQPGFGGGASATVTPARGGAGAGLGGAVFNMQGSLTIRNSTLTANTARGGEQGGPNPSQDVAKGFGGAVFNLNGSVSATEHHGRRGQRDLQPRLRRQRDPHGSGHAAQHDPR